MRKQKTPDVVRCRLCTKEFATYRADEFYAQTPTASVDRLMGGLAARLQMPTHIVDVSLAFRAGCSLMAAILASYLGFTLVQCHTSTAPSYGLILIPTPT